MGKPKLKYEVTGGTEHQELAQQRRKNIVEMAPLVAHGREEIVAFTTSPAQDERGWKFPFDRGARVMQKAYVACRCSSATRALRCPFDGSRSLSVPRLWCAEPWCCDDERGCYEVRGTFSA